MGVATAGKGVSLRGASVTPTSFGQLSEAGASAPATYGRSTALRRRLSENPLTNQREIWR